MKKFYSSLCLIVLMLSLAACGGKKTAAEQSLSTQAEVEETAEKASVPESSSLSDEMETNDEENDGVRAASGFEESTDEVDANKNSEESSPDGVSPDFKAMMDSYEEFFNSYVDFMKKYQESDNSLEMLMEYTDFMKQYTEMMGKLEDVDTDELSTEDYKYYIDVMGRINKKLLEAVDS